MERGGGTLIRTELKEVTVLFADIVDSTRLVQELDPERASEALDPVLTTMIDAVRQRDGTVTSIQGDGIMAIFGAPIAIEDHAVRACFAAIQIVESQIAAKQVFDNDPIKVRIGLDSGQVLLRTYQTGSEYRHDAIGLIVHLANKMQSHARPNGIQISARTERLARGNVLAEKGEPYHYQGRTHDCFRLTGRAPVSRRAVRQSRLLCKAVGRAPLIKELNNRLVALTGGSGGSVLIEAEAGVGKTRLLYEFSELCRQEDVGILQLEGKLNHRRTILLPFRNLLNEVLEIGRQENISTIDEKLSLLVARYNFRSAYSKLALSSLFDSDIQDPFWKNANPDWRRETLIDSMVDLLVAMAKEEPLIVFVEDAHLMDSGSIETVRRITKIATKNRILLIASQRPEGSASLRPDDFDEFVPLKPLDQHESRELCDVLLGNDPGLDALKNELIRRTAGVPLFLEEIVLNFLETGAFHGEIGRAVQREQSQLDSTLGLPSSVKAILAARIDRLPTACHDLIRLASVIGERFPRGLLQAAARVNRQTFNQLVKQLEESKLIVSGDDALESSLAFSHALAQQVCYTSLVTQFRQRYHRSVAEALAEYYGERVTNYTADLAYHYAEAGDTVTAIDLWQHAANRALSGAANTEAVDALEKALELVKTFPERDDCNRKKKLELLTMLGSAQIVSKGPGSDDVVKTYEECRRLADLLGQSRELFRSIWGQWRIAWRVPTKIELANQLTQLAQLSDVLGEEQLQAYHAQWVSCYNNGDFHNCLANIHAALKFYRNVVQSEQGVFYGGHDPAVCGYGEAALTYWILGDERRGAEMARLAMEVAEETGHSGSMGHAMDYALFFYQHCEDLNSLLSLSKKAILFAQDKALPHYEARAKAWRAWALARDGSAEDGVAQMRAAIEEQRLTGIEEDFPVFLEVLAGLEVEVGEFDMALRSCDEALTLAEKSGMRHWLAAIHRRRGTVLQKLGATYRDKALASFDMALAIAIEQDAQSFERLILGDLQGYPERIELRESGNKGDNSPRRLKASA